MTTRFYQLKLRFRLSRVKNRFILRGREITAKLADAAVVKMVEKVGEQVTLKARGGLLERTHWEECRGTLLGRFSKSLVAVTPEKNIGKNVKVKETNGIIGKIP